MQLSCRLPNADYLGFRATAHGIAETAVKAESLGYDAVFVNDHIIVQGPPSMVDSWGNTFDPLTSLSYVAAVTERIRLGTSVLIVPYRNPIATAKAIATVDQFSNGRVIVGAGAGWSEPEFDALAVPYGSRGARTDEHLAVWQACWAPDPVSFDGEFTRFADMHCAPKPVQQPGPPIWIGGLSRPALRRAARFAEVWQPVPTSLDGLLQSKAYLAEQCDAIGRTEPPAIRMSFRVNVTEITGANAYGDDGQRLRGHGTAYQIAEDMAGFVEAAEVDAFQINLNGTPGLTQLHEQMALVMAEIKPILDRLA